MPSLKNLRTSYRRNALQAFPIWLNRSSKFQYGDIQIDQAETDINRLTYRLYKLTDEEIRMVEKEKIW